MSKAFDEFVEIIATLRGPNGCTWDKQQTHESLKPFFVEETYEALQAIDDKDPVELAAELGDVLLQIGLHAEIGRENGQFTIDDVIGSINEKLVRRHPHVFGGIEVDGVDEILTNWEAIKRTEKGEKQPESVLDGVPLSLPALLLALEVSKKAARSGFEWPDLNGVMDKMREEVNELEDEVQSTQNFDKQRISEEIGDLLFTIVNVARWTKVDPEESLRTMVKRFSTRFKAMESAAKQSGSELSELSPEEWDAHWERAKAQLK